MIDQVFKYPEWSKELRMCYDRFPNLKIVFTGSSVMRLKEENMELRDIVKSYNLRGFSFREYLNLQTGMKFHAYPLEEILSNHEQIAKGILSKVRPLDYMQDYMHHGFYPFFLEKRNFSENLLKTMNMMVEVDILLIKQIELKYLSKIKKLLYLLAVDGPKGVQMGSRMGFYIGFGFLGNIIKKIRLLQIRIMHIRYNHKRFPPVAVCIFYIASIVDMPIVVSSRTSRRTFTVSRDVSIVTLFWLAQRRIKTPSA